MTNPTEARIATAPETRRRTSFWRDGLIAVPPLAYLAVLFFVPLGIAIVMSFWTVVNYRPHPAFSFGNYVEAMTAPLNAQILGRTLLLSLFVTIVAAVLGYPASYFLARRVKRFQAVLVVLAILPLWTSYLIRTFAWIPILSRRGLINQTLLSLGWIVKPIDWLLYSQFAVILVLVGVYLPYMILPTYAVLERLDERLIEAATDLGAGPARRFWHIVLPLSAPGLAVGCLFIFVLALGSYVTPALVGGTSGTLIGQQITVQFLQLANQPLGSAMALIVVAISLILATLVLRGFGAGEFYGK